MVKEFLVSSIRIFMLNLCRWQSHCWHSSHIILSKPLLNYSFGVGNLIYRRVCYSANVCLRSCMCLYRMCPISFLTILHASNRHKSNNAVIWTCRMFVEEKVNEVTHIRKHIHIKHTQETNAREISWCGTLW